MRHDDLPHFLGAMIANWLGISLRGLSTGLQVCAGWNRMYNYFFGEAKAG